MSNKSLTRFYVRHSGFDAELFSVRELTGGDLMVKHKPIFYERTLFNHFDQDEVIHEKYSVHVSPNSNGHVLTHDRSMKRDGLKRKAWFVDVEPNNPFLTVLYSRRHTNLVERLFKCNFRTRDTGVEVANFDITKSSLITHVFVGQRDGIDLGGIGLPWDVVTHRFRKFEIHVVKGFIPYKSITQGCHREPLDRSRLKSLNVDTATNTIAVMNDMATESFMPRAITEYMNASSHLIDQIPVGAIVRDGPFIEGMEKINAACKVQRFPSP